MSKDETIDFLRAMLEQHGTKQVLIDGVSHSVGTVCLNAIDIIQELENTHIIQNANQIVHIDRVNHLDL